MLLNILDKHEGIVNKKYKEIKTQKSPVSNVDGEI